MQYLQEVREHGRETRPAALVERVSAEQKDKNEAIRNAIAEEVVSRGQGNTSDRP